jgi:hypothetical protein
VLAMVLPPHTFSLQTLPSMIEMSSGPLDIQSSKWLSWWPGSVHGKHPRTGRHRRTGTHPAHRHASAHQHGIRPRTGTHPRTGRHPRTGTHPRISTGSVRAPARIRAPAGTHAPARDPSARTFVRGVRGVTGTYGGEVRRWGDEVHSVSRLQPDGHAFHRWLFHLCHVSLIQSRQPHSGGSDNDIDGPSMSP